MVSMRMRMLQFDARPFMRAVERANRRNLTQAADEIRDVAQGSMQRRVGLAPPGHPPYMRSRWLKRSVRSGFDRGTRTSVAGPERARGAGATEERLLMRSLEFGDRYALGRRAKKRRKVGVDEKVVVTIQPKPYMAPALDKERSRLPRMWADAIIGG
jgi:hypothetical protein